MSNTLNHFTAQGFKARALPNGGVFLEPTHAAKVAAIKSLPKQAQPLPVRTARAFNPF